MTDRILSGRYRIEEKIGSGGMADVYKGTDLELDREVAVKILKQEFSEDPQYLRRLTREAQAMVSIENEHVVSLYDMGSEEGVHYLVLEYVDGRTLREYMDEKGPMKPSEAVRLISDVLDGLSEAHKHDLVHRDVKPQNILITDDGLVKLTDFGIAKFTGNYTKTFDGKEAVGSVYYISPEQAQGEEVDAKADIYSVGAMLYEMLLGRPPFIGDNAVQVALKHVNEEMVPLHSANRSISPALSDVVAKATAKDKALRYNTADQMIADLSHALTNPHSRFARIMPAGERPVPKKNGRFLKDHLPLIVILGGVLGAIAIFTAMFFITTGLSKKDDLVKVPSFLGYTEESAAAFAENRGFKIQVVGYEESDEYLSGEICDQDPKPQTKVKDGTVVSVIISNGMTTVRVPLLFGLTVDEAKKILEDNGLVLDTEILYDETSEFPVGTVISQSVNADETVMQGHVVQITVSKEPSSETAKMPLLVGEDIETAIELLQEVGIENFRLIITDEEEAGAQYADYSVVAQSPESGIDVIKDVGIVEITMFKSDWKTYKSEFSETITLNAETNIIIITMQTDLGEIILYKETVALGTDPLLQIPFTAYFWESGGFNCVTYVNGEVYKIVSHVFE